MSDSEQTPISNGTSDSEDERIVAETVKEAIKDESGSDKEEEEPAKIVRSTIVRPDVNAVADENPKQRRSHSPPSLPTGPRYAPSRRSPPGDPNRPRVIDVDPIRRRERERQLALQASQSQDKPKKEVDPVAEQKILQLTTRTGGAYIPPHRLRQMQQDVSDKSSPEYQRITWEALKKSINGLINKVNTSNIKEIVFELFGENLIRGRGLFARSIMKAQSASLSFTPVYASVLSVINSKLPQVGELLLTRLIIQFRRAFKRNDKTVCLATTTFIAHLTNQYVAHEIIALQMLALLLERPTDDSVEIAVGFMKEVGAHLAEVSPKANNAAYERFRSILHEGQIDKRVQYMVEVLFQVRKDKYKDNPAISKDLDLVEEDDQITHYLGLDDDGLQVQEQLNVFQMDPNYLENEAKFTELKKEILNGGSEDDGENGESSSDEDSEEGSEDEAALENKMEINDQTNADLISLRRNIYLTIMSALDFEECVHKLMKLQVQPGQEMELCNMITDCCSQERTYEKYYGLIGERLSKLNRTWSENFEQGFVNTYQTIHRYETNRLRNVAKYFGHLLFTDAISWEVLGVVHLNEEETTSASRIFVKIMLQELSEHMGLKKLRERLMDPYMKESFQGMFPRDNPKHTRFAINYFTSVGLGGLTDELREWLKNAPKMIMSQPREESDSDDSGSESDDSDSDDSSDSEDSSSESESESKSESSKDDRRRRRRNSKDRYSSNRGKTSNSHRKASPSPPPESRSSRRGRSLSHSISRSRSPNSRSRSPLRSLSRSSRPRYSRSPTPNPHNRHSSKIDRRTRRERSISRTRSRSRSHSPRKRRHSLSPSPPPRRVRGRDRSPLSPVSPTYRRQRSHTPDDNNRRSRYRSRSRESIKRKARDDSRDGGRGLKRRGRDVKWDEKDRDRSRDRSRDRR